MLLRTLFTYPSFYSIGVFSLGRRQTKCTRMGTMIKKVASVKNMDDKRMILDDLRYWLSKPSEERVAAVDYLRRQVHGSSGRLQRVARVVQSP